MGHPADKLGEALPKEHRLYPYVVLAAAVVAVVRCALTVGVFNHTTDELAHIAGAVGLWESGRNIHMVEHPTLQRIWVGGVLKAAGVEYPPARGIVDVQDRADANAAGEDIVFHGAVPYWRVLAIARLANLVSLAVLLGYSFLLGRYLVNALAGMLGAVFLSLDPNILGHAALVTTDVPAAAGFVAASYYAVRFVARANWKRAVAAGVALGLAMSCKFTCVLLAPGVVVLMLARATWKKARSRKRRFWAGAPRLRYLFAIPVVAFVTLWGTYLFNVGRLKDQHLFEKEKTWQRIPGWVKGVTIPMPSMPLGMMFMGAIGKQGFPSYLNGEITPGGRWYYFPEAMALKTPVGFVAAFVAAALVFAMWRRRPWVVLVLVICPSVLMLSAMVGKLQIGVRHVLPVLPFLYLFVAVQLCRGWKLVGVGALMLVAAVEGALAHPDYIAFFNVLARGNGSQYLADSNLDWGQDVGRLAEYLKKSGRKDYVIKVSGVRVAALVEFLGLDPASRGVDPEELKKNPRGVLALGVNARLGLEDARIDPDGRLKAGTDWDWVEGYAVIARIGRSIVVYDLRRKERPSP